MSLICLLLNRSLFVWKWLQFCLILNDSLVGYKTSSWQYLNAWEVYWMSTAILPYDFEAFLFIAAILYFHYKLSKYRFIPEVHILLEDTGKFCYSLFIYSMLTPLLTPVRHVGASQFVFCGALFYASHPVTLVLLCCSWC